MSAKLRALGVIVVLGWVGMAFSSVWGCLRPTLDARGIEWSQLIVKGTFRSVGEAQNLGNAGWQYRIYIFQINEVLDGSAGVNGQISVVRFVGPMDTRSGPCAQSLTKDQIGKSFYLLLRRQENVSWSENPSDADPRTAELHQLNAYLIVNIQSSDDLDADGVADLKHQISDVRSAEAQFVAADAQTQATVLANAADATEAQEAEHALLEMGFKAADTIKAVEKGASAEGQIPLKRVVDAISPPSIVEESSATTRP
jgi:hypothetical protein